MYYVQVLFAVILSIGLVASIPTHDDGSNNLQITDGPVIDERSNGVDEPKNIGKGRVSKLKKYLKRYAGCLGSSDPNSDVDRCIEQVDANSTPNDDDNLSQVNVDSASSVKSASDDLHLLFLVYRHGDRAPLDFAPGDPYKETADELWPTGLARLTNNGKDRMFRLGQYLRGRYGNYLGNSDPDQVYARSSLVDRCVTSAQLVLAGMYPPEGKLVWNEDLLWQPIPVYPDMMLFWDQCPARDREYEEKVERGEALRDVLSKKVEGVVELTDKLESEYGYKFETIEHDYYDAYSTLNIELDRNLTLPEWLANSMPKLNEIVYHSDLMWTKTDQLKRFIVGVFLNDIVEKMNEYRARQELGSRRSGKNYKLFQYCTHDTNIHSLLNTLGVFQGQVTEYPGFGSTIAIELHRSNQHSDYSVKLFYLGDSREEDDGLRELTLTDCLKDGESVCSLDMFTEFTEPYRLSENEFSEECKIPSDSLVDSET